MADAVRAAPPQDKASTFEGRWWFSNRGAAPRPDIPGGFPAHEWHGVGDRRPWTRHPEERSGLDYRPQYEEKSGLDYRPKYGEGIQRSRTRPQDEVYPSMENVLPPEPAPRSGLGAPRFAMNQTAPTKSDITERVDTGFTAGGKPFVTEPGPQGPMGRLGTAHEFVGEVPRLEELSPITEPKSAPLALKTPEMQPMGISPSSAIPGQQYASAETENAVDRMLTMRGWNTTQNRNDIKEYMRTGGVNMDPARAAWCAGFLNATLRKGDAEGGHRHRKGHEP